MGQELGEPERSESSREHAVPIRTNPSEANEGHGFFSGHKPLERRYEVRKGFVGKRQSGERDLRGSLDH
jgi:hypothetical protein